MTPTPAPALPTIRALAPADLSAVVAIDAAGEGRTRRDYVERRLRAAQREPALHAQFAASDGSGVVGFMLARVLAGEFGRHQHGTFDMHVAVDKTGKDVSFLNGCISR